jgi:hypothetical protein
MQGTGVNLQQKVWRQMCLTCGSEQTELLLPSSRPPLRIGHSQRGELNSAAKSTEKHYRNLKQIIIMFFSLTE